MRITNFPHRRTNTMTNPADLVLYFDEADEQQKIWTVSSPKKIITNLVLLEKFHSSVEFPFLVGNLICFISSSATAGSSMLFVAIPDSAPLLDRLLLQLELSSHLRDRIHSLLRWPEGRAMGMVQNEMAIDFTSLHP